MPALDFALGHWVIGRAAKVFDVAVVEPFGQVTGDVAGTVVGQHPKARIADRGMRHRSPSLAASFRRMLLSLK